MYLKALEIQGFKSFPDKTVLTFGNDITAIVGPNGSGKSNIADAIRWVMGEQSTKELRGGKMEDVIFGGTPKRAQVGFAQVSLIIDNSAGVLPLDETEVMVTRRYYRSGESEFYINRRSVRLRDINELFMDTGMGREGYSVIGQGRIDEILSTRSGDRREVFESAAGIARFRRRKEEAERRIAATDANLLRINDKVEELELQVEPLRRQSENAKKYLVLRDELRVVEVSLWMDTLEKLRADSLKTRSDFDAVRRELDEMKTVQDRLYAEGEELSERLHELDIQGEAARTELSRLEALESELKSSAAVLRVNIENNLENLKQIREDQSRQSRQAEAFDARIREYEGRKNEIEGQRAALSEQTRELMKDASSTAESSGELEDRLELMRAKLELVNAAREEAAVKLSALSAAADEMRLSFGASEEETAAAAAALEAAVRDKAALASALDKEKESQSELENVINGYRMRVSERDKRCVEQDKKVAGLTMDKNMMAARIKLLSDMEREYEGYSKVVKTVMQEHTRGALKGIHGPLGSLIGTQREYALAIEIALGAAAQNIVVDTEQDAKAAINFLKRKDGGRATFLPINVIRGRKMTEDLSKEPGYLGAAAELVRRDEKYSQIVESFLGRTVIADNMDNAIAMAKKSGHRLRIVTLDGQLINPGGSLTGGSAGKNVGILSRAEELGRLKTELEKLEESMKQEAGALSELIRLKEAAAFQLETAEGEKRVKDDEVLKLESELRYRSERQSEAEKELELLEKQRAGLAERIRESELTSAEAGAATGARRLEAETLEKELAEIESGREEMRQKGDGITARIMRIAAEDAALGAELATTERAAAEQRALLDELMLSGQDREKAAEARAQSHAELNEQLKASEDTLGSVSDDCETQRGLVKTIGENRLELEAERTRRDKELQESGRNLMNLEREYARLEQKTTAADLEEKQLIDKLWESYELNYTTAQPVRRPIESFAKSKNMASGLRQQISALGTPNLGAIEEFERVNTRYSFLTGERDDIEAAKKELLKIIEDITSQMRDVFSEQFRLINGHFNETFSEMFGGGRASVELEDGEDILDCGIEIKAQPPGKSLKTISLLSGGEKAFAAIALYFAMMKVRPTPFCVIDEIDAALDAANVVRFADYMRKMSVKTQFIVITHRRSTMERADVLYGITMQEHGISKMLTINLSEAEKEYVS